MVDHAEALEQGVELVHRQVRGRLSDHLCGELLGVAGELPRMSAARFAAPPCCMRLGRRLGALDAHNAV
jgi:hypothetical protein